MVNRNLLRQYDLPEGELQQELDAAFHHGGADWLPPEEQAFQGNRLVTGRVRRATKSGWTSATRARAPSSCANGTTTALIRLSRPSRAMRSRFGLSRYQLPLHLVDPGISSRQWRPAVPCRREPWGRKERGNGDLESEDTKEAAPDQGQATAAREAAQD